MKKLGIKAGLLLWAASLLLTSLGVPAQAAGESYEWQGADRKTVVAEGGIYTQPTTFTESLRTATSATYTTTADTFRCTDGTSFDADLKLTVPTTGQATLSAQARCGLNPDTNIEITGGNSEVANTSVSTSECTGGVLTWIVCPIFSFLTETIEWVENDVIVPFLRIDPLAFDTNNPQQAMWRSARNLANIGFVIILLVIVFANTLSLQLDYYTIKRSIPRLVLAAIAIQFSYLIVALAIDVTNVLGEGIGQIVLSPIEGQNQVNITDLIGGLGLAGGLSVAFAALGSIVSGGFLVVVVAAFFAVMAVFATLVFRQILITFLLIVAPLAIMAWVLPNTEGWFKLWKNTLVKTLMMYPLLVLFFVSGKIFGAATSASTGAGAGNDSFRSLISVVAILLPLLLVPFAFKFAGSAMVAGSALIGRLVGTSRGITEKSGLYERFSRRTKERKAELAAGHGVTFGRGDMSMTAFKGGVGRTLGRGFYGSVAASPRNWANTQGGNIRAMLDFNQLRDQKRDQMKKEGTTFEGYQILSKGMNWYNDEIQKARGEGNTERVARLQDALVEARYNNRFRDSTARAAATMFLSDIGQIGNSDREGIREWMGNTEGGRYVANATWRSAREGARKITPQIAYTNLEGEVDTAGLVGWFLSQNQSTMTGFTTDAFEKMRENGTLELMARTENGRDVLAKLAGGGGPAAGGAQQTIIRSVLSATPAPAPGAPTIEFAYIDNTGSLRAVSRAAAQAYKDSGQGARVIKIDKSVADLT